MHRAPVMCKIDSAHSYAKTHLLTALSGIPTIISSCTTAYGAVCNQFIVHTTIHDRHHLFKQILLHTYESFYFMKWEVLNNETIC